MRNLLMGIDLGTGGCKITAIDKSGNLVGEASEEYPTSHPKPGWAEQNPADWHKAMCKALRQLLKNIKPSDIAAISLDGSTHNAVLLDKNFNVLRPVIMWTDQRSREEAAWLEENHGERISKIAYQRPTPTWTLPQMLWIKNNEPEVLRKTANILFVKDYIRFLLTGEMCTDYIEAQGTLFHDIPKREWSEELCGLGGVPFNALPRLVKPTEIVGKITALAAGDTGLSKGTPVVCGCSDSAVEDYAAGAIEPGQCIVKLATAGNVNIMTSDPHPHPRTLTYSHVMPGMWYTVSATNSAASCLRWFRDNFCDEMDLAAKEAGVNVYQLMEESALSSSPGANGIFFHPYLQGERSPYWDPDLRGSFIGVSMANKKSDFIRSVMEGVAFSLRDCRRTIDNMGLEIREIRLIGGGSKSKLWSQIICDVFNRPVVLPGNSDASFGSALLAGVGTGIFQDEHAAVKQCVKTAGSLQPSPENADLYDGLFKKYLQLHDALAPMYGVKGN